MYIYCIVSIYGYKHQYMGTNININRPCPVIRSGQGKTVNVRRRRVLTEGIKDRAKGCLTEPWALALQVAPSKSGHCDSTSHCKFNASPPSKIQDVENLPLVSCWKHHVHGLPLSSNFNSSRICRVVWFRETAMRFSTF